MKIKYGNWTVLEDEDSKEKSVLCRCRCGTVRKVSLANLKKGYSTSCGCRGTPKIRIGSKFGYLTVIEITDNKTVKCKCICGQIITTTASQLKNKRIKTCGCRARKKIIITNGMIINNSFEVIKQDQDKVFKTGIKHMWTVKCLKCGRIYHKRESELATGNIKCKEKECQ